MERERSDRRSRKVSAGRVLERFLDVATDPQDLSTRT